MRTRWIALLLTLTAAVPTVAAAAEPPPEPVTEGTTEQPTVDDEVVVVANRSATALAEVPASVSVLDMEKLKKRGFTVGADELRGEPGIYFRRGEGDNDDFLFINIRGVVGNHGNDTFLALVDGVPFVGPDEEVLMTEVPYAAVEAVEIVRGPVSALYGRGGIAGAINYRLAAGPYQPRLTLALGSDDYQNLRGAWGSSGSKAQVFLALDAQRANGWREQNEQERLNLFGRLVGQLGASTSLAATLNFLDREYDTGSVIPTFSDGEPIEVRGGREGFIGSRDTGADQRSTMVALRLDHQVHADLGLELTTHWRQADSSNQLDFFDSFATDPAAGLLVVNGFDSQSDTSTLFAEAVTRLQHGNAQSTFGVSAERSTLDDADFWTGQFGFTFECGFAFFEIRIDASTGEILNRNHPCWVERLPRLDGDTTNTFFGGFGQTEWKIGSDWTLAAGLRWDSFDRRTELVTGTPLTERERVDASESAFSPKLSLSRRVGDRHLLYASYGRGFSSNFGPVWQWDPSQYARDVKPTTLDSVEVGAKGRSRDGRLTWSTALFALEQRDRLLFTANPAAETDFTAPGTLATTGQRYRSVGLELWANWQVSGSTRLDLSGSYIEPEWTELIIDTFAGPIDRSGTEPTGVPHTIFQVAVDQQLGSKVDGRVWWEYYGDYFITQDNRFRGGQYDLLNLSLSWREPLQWVEALDFSVTNALDHEYDYIFGGTATSVSTRVPGVPRQLRLTARLGLGGARR